MDTNRIKELAELLNEYGLTEIEVEEKDARVYLSKAAAVAPAAVAPAQVAQTTPAVAAQEVEAAGEGLESPLVGVAYLASAPGEAPFVKVGQNVKKGQTLCILEAMKVMNEFTAPKDGVVLEICVGNEELVEFGQVLFRLG